HNAAQYHGFFQPGAQALVILIIVGIKIPLRVRIAVPSYVRIALGRIPLISPSLSLIGIASSLRIAGSPITSLHASGIASLGRHLLRLLGVVEASPLGSFPVTLPDLV